MIRRLSTTHSQVPPNFFGSNPVYYLSSIIATSRKSQRRSSMKIYCCRQRWSITSPGIIYLKLSFGPQFRLGSDEAALMFPNSENPCLHTISLRLETLKLRSTRMRLNCGKIERNHREEEEVERMMKAEEIRRMPQTTKSWIRLHESLANDRFKINWNPNCAMGAVINNVCQKRTEERHRNGKEKRRTRTEGKRRE